MQKESIVKDPGLAPDGHRKIDWAARHSPVLNRVRDEYLKDGTFEDLGVGVALPIEAKTAYLTVVPDEADRELERALDQAAADREAVLIDDRAGLARLAHTTRRNLLGNIRGASEETTSGVANFRAMEREGILEFPVVAANDARCK